jgi:hypothetical protein
MKKVAASNPNVWGDLPKNMAATPVDASLVWLCPRSATCICPKGFKLEAPIGVVRAERFYLKRNGQFIERDDRERPQADKTGLSLANSKETWSAN